MWFVVPQITGLGRSPMAQRYALASVEAAAAYAADPVLGPRLRACAQALLTHDGLDAFDILGGIDATKLRSSMTLVARATPGEPLFALVLERFFDGEHDPQTVCRL